MGQGARSRRGERDAYGPARFSPQRRASRGHPLRSSAARGEPRRARVRAGGLRGSRGPRSRAGGCRRPRGPSRAAHFAPRGVSPRPARLRAFVASSSARAWALHTARRRGERVDPAQPDGRARADPRPPPAIAAWAAGSGFCGRGAGGAPRKRGSERDALGARSRLRAGTAPARRSCGARTVSLRRRRRGARRSRARCDSAARAAAPAARRGRSRPSRAAGRASRGARGSPSRP